MPRRTIQRSSTGPTFIERRRAARSSVPRLLVGIVHGESGSYWAANAVDLSVDGLMVHLDEPLEPGDRVRVTFQVDPDGIAEHRTAAVVRAEAGLVALRFEEGLEDEREPSGPRATVVST